ncbi:hypothetical protein LTR17_022437 [Elasticomyces elasticus]|nr:hypothetical protein LTR17_022437 [Elasticomyces elasticus]
MDKTITVSLSFTPGHDSFNLACIAIDHIYSRATHQPYECKDRRTSSSAASNDGTRSTTEDRIWVLDILDEAFRNPNGVSIGADKLVPSSEHWFTAPTARASGVRSSKWGFMASLCGIVTEEPAASMSKRLRSHIQIMVLPNSLEFRNSLRNCEISVDAQPQMVVYGLVEERAHRVCDGVAEEIAMAVKTADVRVRTRNGWSLVLR